MKIRFSIKDLEIFILLLTMIFTFWYAKTASREFKIKNKPIVGIEKLTAKYIIPEDGPRIGKSVTWNSGTKTFICEGQPVDIKSLLVLIQIKNFGTEPALDFNYDYKIKAGNRSITSEDPEYKASIIMPSQMLTYTFNISKADLLECLQNERKITLELTLKYTDLAKKTNLYEYFAEILILDDGKISLKITNSLLKDKRKFWF